MKKLTANDFRVPGTVNNLVWNYGTAKVKRCLRKMRIYAKFDFEVPENEIEEVVKEAMSVCCDIEDDEIIWESLNLILWHV